MTNSDASISIREISLRRTGRSEVNKIEKMLSGSSLSGLLFTKLNGSKSVMLRDSRPTKARMKRSYSSGLDQFKEKFPLTYGIMSSATDKTRRLSFSSLSASTRDSLRYLHRFPGFTPRKTRFLDFSVPQKVLLSMDASTKRNPKFKWKRFVPRATAAIIGIIYMEYYLFKQDLSRIVPEDVESIGKHFPQEYLNLHDPMDFPVGSKFQGLAPWVSRCASLDHALAWRLVEETKSDDPIQRATAIRKLAGLRNLSDAECRAIAYMIDFRTGIELANSHADSRMIAFNHCRFPKRYEVLLPTKFRELFNALPPDKIHPEVNAIVWAVISHYSPTEGERDERHMDTATGFESEPIIVTRQKTFSEIQLIYHCLLGALSHTRNKEQIPIMFRCGLVDLLSDISAKYENNQLIISIVSKLYGNLSSHPDFYQEVKNSGILHLISELSHSPIFHINLPARKALHNLDRSSNTPILPPGIYQLYPDFKTDELLLMADIILVHGVKGSTFRTWRSHDSLAAWLLGSESRAETKTDKLTLIQDLKGKLSGLKDYVPFLSSQKNLDSVNVETRIPKAEGKLREKLRLLRERLYQPENPILGNDEDTDQKPLNREYRNGELHYFQDGEKVVLEPTFTAAQPTPCWPRDWLPKDVSGARILSVDYDSFVSHWYAVRPIETHGRTVEERGKELAEKLVAAGVGKRPIIWVTHSAGGLLAKQVIQSASESEDPEVRKLCTNTRAVFFYSTPHFGSNLASLTTTGNLLLPTIEMKEMAAGSKTLIKLNENFKKTATENNFHVTSFGEMLGTKTGMGVYVKMVSLKSSDPGYGEYFAVKVDHIDICKPTSRGSFIYTKLVDYVNKLLQELRSQ